MNDAQKAVNEAVAKTIDSMQQGVEKYGESHTGLARYFGRTVLHNGKVALLKVEITTDADEIEEYGMFHTTPMRMLPLIESTLLKEGLQ